MVHIYSHLNEANLVVCVCVVHRMQAHTLAKFNKMRGNAERISGIEHNRRGAAPFTLYYNQLKVLHLCVGKKEREQALARGIVTSQ